MQQAGHYLCLWKLKSSGRKLWLATGIFSLLKVDSKQWLRQSCIAMACHVQCHQSIRLMGPGRAASDASPGRLKCNSSLSEQASANLERLGNID